MPALHNPVLRASCAWPSLLGLARIRSVGAGAYGSGRAVLQVCCFSKQRRYVLPPVYLNRSDLTWGTAPWRFEQTCFASDLELKHPALSGDITAQDVIVNFSVDSPSHSAPGLWVKGTVATVLVLQCEWCTETFTQRIDQAFNVWLNGKVAGDADLTSAEELAFPSGDETCDLSPAVVDAISLALPSVCLCGGKHCKTLGSQLPLWAASTPQPSKGGSSPFASLLRGITGRGAAKSRQSGNKKLR